MKATIWHYAGCGTCKKALRWLAERGVEVELVPIVESPPTARELARLVRASGKPARAFFNLSGQSYRALVAERGKPAVAALDDAEILALLAADGKLVKRPVLKAGELVLVGFDEAAYERAFPRAEPRALAPAGARSAAAASPARSRKST